MRSACAVITLSTELDSFARQAYRRFTTFALIMESHERSPVPAAMSHRQLAKLLKSASAEAVSDHHSEGNTLDKELQAWSVATQQLLRSMSTSHEAMTSQRTPHQVMALGSLRTHLLLGLQALKAAGSR